MNKFNNINKKEKVNLSNSKINKKIRVISKTKIIITKI